MMGLSGKEKRQPEMGRAPLPSLVRIGQGEGGGAPPFLPLFLLLPPSPTPTRKEGSPTPGGSRTPPSCLVGEGRGKGEGGKGGAPPPFLVQFGLGGEGARGLPWPALLFSLMAH